VPVERDEEKIVSSEEGGENEAFLKSTGNIVKSIGGFKAGFMEMDLKTFYRYVVEEMPSEARYGFAFLALFYVLINNTVSLLDKLRSRECETDWEGLGLLSV